jgi:hypothetical protein
LFTLHAIWPLVFIWALTHKKDLADQAAIRESAEDLSNRLAQLEKRLTSIEERDPVDTEKESVQHG